MFVKVFEKPASRYCQIRLEKERERYRLSITWSVASQNQIGEKWELTKHVPLFGRFFFPILYLFFCLLGFCNIVRTIYSFFYVAIHALQHRNQFPVLETKICVYLTHFCSHQNIPGVKGPGKPLSTPMKYLFNNSAIITISFKNICQKQIGR